MKGLPFETAKKNLEMIVQLRSELKSPTTFHASILTQPYYYECIGEREKITVQDETLDTFHYLRDILNYGYEDSILHPFVLTWAEREKRKKPKTNAFCMGMFNFGNKIFIDTDGNVYPCCLDYNSDVTFGNINKESMMAIWDGEKRKRFIELYLHQRFSEIGRPCLYCQD